MKEHDQAFHIWLNEKDADLVTRFMRCTGYLTDTEKDLAYALMQLAFTSGYVRGKGLLGGGNAAYPEQ